MSVPQLPSISPLSKFKINHEINNQGCRCELCQKVVFNQTMAHRVSLMNDKHSEEYNSHQQETYLSLIDQLMGWEKRTRKLRLCLPELCVFSNGNPVHLISKSKDTTSIKIVRSKSKLNVFQLQHFFLDGYLSHNPQITNKKREKHEFKQKMRQLCTVAAKYSNNVTALFTLEQLSNMFKSKFKYMRDQLMYMQTLVGGQQVKEYMLRIDLDDIERENGQLFARAKLEASIFVGEIKITDAEYYLQKHEVEYERELRLQDKKQYLTYLTLKIILISSKNKPTIIKQSIFKWSCVKGNDYLWDVRIITLDKSSKYWQSSVMQALEIKLQKTMSMIQFGTEASKKIKREELSQKAQEMSRWLEKSTEDEWNQMKIVRNRLEKLEQQRSHYWSLRNKAMLCI